MSSSQDKVVEALRASLVENERLRKPVANSVYCCGVIGLTHKYNANDVHGTDFMLALAYGWRDSGGCCIAVNCGTSTSYCVGAEEEEDNDDDGWGNDASFPTVRR